MYFIYRNEHKLMTIKSFNRSVIYIFIVVVLYKRNKQHVFIQTEINWKKFTKHLVRNDRVFLIKFFFFIF